MTGGFHFSLFFQRPALFSALNLIHYVLNFQIFGKLLYEFSELDAEFKGGKFQNPKIPFVD